MKTPESAPHSQTYEILIAGILDARWAEWLGGMDVDYRPDGVTRLYGAVIDQTALYGLLSRLRDLGVDLLLVRHVPFPDEAPDRADGPS